MRSTSSRNRGYRCICSPPSNPKKKNFKISSSSNTHLWKKEKKNLFGAETNDAAELCDDQVDTLETGLLEAGDLLLDDGLEGQIGREEADADAVNVADGEGDLAPQLLLVKLHLDDLEREALVEEPVDLGPARQFHRVDIGRARALDGPLEIRLHQLDHPKQQQQHFQLISTFHFYQINNQFNS